jgi:hypothetical protein
VATGSAAEAIPMKKQPMAILEITGKKGYTNTMVKTVLKMVLGVLVLAAVFFAGILYWEKTRTKPEPVPPPAEEKAAVVSSIRAVTVTPSEEGATIRISEIGTPNYRVNATTSPNGLEVDIPSITVTLAPNVVARAHALVPMVEVIPTFAQGESGAKIRIELASGASFKERWVGKVLVVEVSRAPEAEPTSRPTDVPTPLPAPSATPAPRKRVAEKKPTPQLVPSVRPADRKPVVFPTPVPTRPPTATPVPTRVPTMAPLRMPTESPTSSDDSALMRELGLEEPSAAEIESAAQVPVMPPKMEEIPTEVPVLSTPIPYYEEPTPARVAMVPTPSPDKFDVSKITKDLPAIYGFNAYSEGGTTTIQIDREARTQYQVFRLVNPPRVVIDFKDAVNKLPPEYPSFAGTRVQRVTTRQFVGPEGTVSRVILHVDGSTVYKQEVKGGTFILRLP